jgi:hypothetical protein
MTVWLGVALLGATVTLSGCLGTLPRSEPTATAAHAAQSALGLPVRGEQVYWLLRAEPGWCNSYQVRYGGEFSDPAFMQVSVAVFRDVASADRGFDRIATPAYLYRALTGHMVHVPWEIEYSAPLPGERTAVLESIVIGPPQPGEPPVEFPLQLTAIRAGRATLLTESIGVDPEHLVPALEAVVQAAAPLGGRC